jgi:hypothetical protein
MMQRLYITAFKEFTICVTQPGGPDPSGQIVWRLAPVTPVTETERSRK